MKNLYKILTFFLIYTLFAQTSLAFSGDIGISNNSIGFSTNNYLEGQTVRIYATVSNISDKDLLGVVRFFDNDKQIGGDQAISIFAKKNDDVFIDWTPSYGAHKIAVKLYPWEPELDDPSNNWAVTNVFAAQDTDHDGITNDKDPDDDNDGVIDEEDAFPLNSGEQYDTDGDGIGDNKDLDDDNDEVPDEFDDMPLDPNETTDTDKDGIGDIADTDDDDDGLKDTEELKKGTNPLETDTDKDGIDDKKDPFPIDSKETIDTDGDGIGDNTDTDDDNDGILDEYDEHPLNKGPIIKLKNKNFTVGLLDTKTFDASPSYDEDGEITKFVWKIDNEIKEGNAVDHTFTKTGKHVIELTITDDQGESRTDELQVNVLNLRLYSQIIISLITILLAMLFIFKYISEDKKSKKGKK